MQNNQLKNTILNKLHPIKPLNINNRFLHFKTYGLINITVPKKLNEIFSLILNKNID